MVRQRERAFDQESFLVDMRSQSGFSGSVVVIYFTQPGTLSVIIGEKRPWRTLISEYWVLGVDWGHLPVRQRLLDNGGEQRVLIDSSMAGVVPAWRLTELLNDVAEVLKPRQRAEAGLAEQPIGGAELDIEGPSPTR